MLLPPSQRPLDVADAVACGDLWARLQYPTLDGDGIYWLDFDPGSGMSSVMQARGGSIERVTPQGVDVRSGVYEYGGGAYAVAHETIVYSDQSDGRLHRIGYGPLTPAGGDVRFGDLVIAADAVLCVRERHEADRVITDVVRVPLSGGEMTVLAAGRDFYAFPCASLDGSSVAWTAWDHPGMPFIGCELWRDGSLVAGGASESIFQPQWAPDGRLHYVSDRSGWWNLHVDGVDEAIGQRTAEVGWPQWFLGLSSYTFLDDGRIAVLVNLDGEQRLQYLAPDGSWTTSKLPHAHVAWPHLRGNGTHVVFVAAEAGAAPEIVLVDTQSGEWSVVRSSLPEGVRIRATSIPERLDIHVGDDRINGFVYEPQRRSKSNLPPLVILAHGGPTDQTVGGLRIDVELLVSRGYVVADVDYRGSTGYGRAYRNRLAGAWGIVDIDDCVAVAETLAGRGRVDQERIVVMGGSAGGYLALCGVAFHDVFRAAVSLYGISDLRLWDTGTHKFEASYTGWLVGSLDAAVLRQRSPASSTAFSGPILLLQGEDDHVVTPDHLETMSAAARAAGVRVESLIFPNEGHGFRSPEHVEAAFSAILAFLESVLGPGDSG